MNKAEATIHHLLMSTGHTKEEADTLIAQFTNELAEDLYVQPVPRGSYGGERYGYHAAVQRLDRTGEHFYWEHV